MKLASALYVGSVVHRRLRPRAHEFRYRCFWLLIDLAELERLSARLRLFSHGRFNLFSFQARDHGDGGATPLREQIDRLLLEQGIELGGGAVRLLCMPRTLGYAFNPLSIYFCYRADGRLAALVHQVHNTFGERHAYVLPVTGEETVKQACAKTFTVSPFLEMDLGYEFRIKPPLERVAVAIRAARAGATMLTACLSGTRRDLTDAALLRVFLAIPAATLKVIAAIHWEALRLWLKGVPLRSQTQRGEQPAGIPAIK